MQYFGCIESNSTDYAVTGSFYNPNLLATHLVLSAILVIGICLTNFKQRVIRLLLTILVSLIVVAIVILASRSALLGLLGGGMVYLIRTNFFQSRRRALTLGTKILNRSLVGLVSILGFLGLFFLKSDSAIGRLLIARISLLSWLDRPVFGIWPF